MSVPEDVRDDILTELALLSDSDKQDTSKVWLAIQEAQVPYFGIGGITQADFIVTTASGLNAVLLGLPNPASEYYSPNGASICLKKGSYDFGSAFLIPQISNIRIFSEGGATIVRPDNDMAIKCLNSASIAYTNLIIERLSFSGKATGNYPIIGLSNPTGSGWLNGFSIRNNYFSNNCYAMVEMIFLSAILADNYIVMVPPMTTQSMVVFSDSRGVCGDVTIKDNFCYFSTGNIQFARLGENPAGAGDIFCGSIEIFDNYIRVNTGIKNGINGSWIFIRNNVNSGITTHRFIHGNKFYEGALSIAYKYMIEFKGYHSGIVCNNHNASNDLKFTNATDTVDKLRVYDNYRTYQNVNIP